MADEREEEEAAAEEAGAIGGPNPDPELSEAERVISEGGEGESEGFELAERDLERNASHDPDGHGNPLLDRIDEESARTRAPSTARPTTRATRKRAHDDGEREESDQLPEEGPGGQVPEDDSDGKARSDAQENSGAEGEEGGCGKQATGNPANAGQE